MNLDLRMRKIVTPLVLLFIVLLSPLKIQAQWTDEDEDIANLIKLESPYHTIKAHLYYLDEDTFNTSLSGKTIYPKQNTGFTKAELAVKLKQIYTAKGLLPDEDRIPRDPNYTDSLTGKKRYYISKDLPGVYLQKYGNRWYYSRKSVEKIPDMHTELYPFGTAKLLKLVPAHSKTYFGIHLWQVVGVLILVICAVIFYKIFTWFFDLILSNVAYQVGHERIADKFIRPVAIPFSLFFIFLLLILFVPLLQLPFKTNYYLLLFIKALLPLFVTIVFYKIADVIAFYLMRLAERTESTLDDQLVPLVRRIMKIFVVIMGSLFALQNLNFDVTALVAGLSIGGLAFALAAQDTIKNFFGSLMIFIDKPFQIGQWIKAQEIDGEIEEVGFRSTRIRTFANSLITVPNGKLADMVIDNMGMRQFRRMNISLTIVYGTPVARIKQFVLGLRAIVDAHPKTRKDNYQISFNNLSAFSYDVLFYVFLLAPTWRDELTIRQELLVSILELAEKLEIEFAFPTQTLFLEGETQQESKKKL